MTTIIKKLPVRISLYAALILSLWLTACPFTAEAKVYIDINAPGGKRLPIAVQELVYAKPVITAEPGSPEALKSKEEADLIERLNEEIYATLVADIEFSGIFDYIERDAYLEDIESSGVTARKTDFSLWRAIGTEILVKGGFNVYNGKLTAEFRLFDTVKETQLIARRYISNDTDPKAVAHRFLDDVMKKLTGVKGIFSTKIMYLKGLGVSKNVYLCDYDGTNPIQLTDNNSINLSPQWSPKGDRFIYTSYMGDNPALYMQNIQSGKVTVVSNKKGINIGGRWSPNGRQIALTKSGKSSPELFVKGAYSKGSGKQLTSNHAIDVSPAWSPDGKQIYYISDIAGNPHIYVINSKGGNTKRVTFEGKYLATPSISPDGETIAFSSLDKTGFNIWTIRTDGSGLTQLTYDGDNQTPSWSPDGRFIVYERQTKPDAKSSIFIIRRDGSNPVRIVEGRANYTSPAWSPYMD